MLTNDDVSFEQLDPDMAIYPYNLTRTKFYAHTINMHEMIALTG